MLFGILYKDIIGRAQFIIPLTIINTLFSYLFKVFSLSLIVRNYIMMMAGVKLWSYIPPIIHNGYRIWVVFNIILFSISFYLDFFLPAPSCYLNGYILKFFTLLSHLSASLMFLNLCFSVLNWVILLKSIFQFTHANFIMPIPLYISSRELFVHF